MRRNTRSASFAMVVVLAVTTGACATFETGETKLRTVKTVGIISAVGDQMTVAKGGLTSLDNGTQRFPIDSWGLDDLIVQRATAALQGRFQVQSLTYNRAAFAVVREPAVAGVNLIQGDPFKKLIRTEVAPQGLDAYIVISKARATIGGSGRKVEGVGLITYSAVTESYSQIYALYEIRIVDGKTFDIIEKMAAPPLDNTGRVRLAGPSRPVDQGLPISSGDGNDPNLRGTIIDLIVRSLPATLNDMHLAAAL